ncbi:FAD:protein FMN transferase [Pseudonocardia acaciae]|uniref:FAD:protein FMN transferase n=1 Tax=Pseudonocardia acaciae TaxID=551276 RepID=UPI000A07890A|nr:FAD:protein FMN transferase [Pseudonocardia acaciae]
MSVGLAPVGRHEMAALGTSALLLVTDPDRLSTAAEVLRAEIAEIDRACSRFRADSEISELHRGAGAAATVGPLLGQALDVALRAAELTDGLVDPTVGAAVRELGYDADFRGPGTLDSPSPDGPARPAPGWWRLHWDPARREVLLPRGVALDLGATAKALAADRAAARAAEVTGCGVLVDLGGDLGTAGVSPEDGWRIAVADDHRDAMDSPEQVVAVHGGGMATSSTVARAWRRAGRLRHHIVDPRTGQNPPPTWRTVTVAAASCVDANVASTAAIVLGADAPGWLTERGLPARLVGPDGRVVCTPGWPASEWGD